MTKRVSVRFNLNKKDELDACEYLHSLRTESINREIIRMINLTRQMQDLREFLQQNLSGLLQAVPRQVDEPAGFSEDDLTVLDFVNSF